MAPRSARELRSLSPGVRSGFGPQWVSGRCGRDPRDRDPAASSHHACTPGKLARRCEVVAGLPTALAEDVPEESDQRDPPSREGEPDFAGALPLGVPVGHFGELADLSAMESSATAPAAIPSARGFGRDDAHAVPALCRERRMLRFERRRAMSRVIANQMDRTSPSRSWRSVSRGPGRPPHP